MPIIPTASAPAPITTASIEDRDELKKANILVAGAVAIDSSCDYTPITEHSTNIVPIPQTSNPARIKQNLGGVGHNVALAASYVGSSVAFCSVVADDLNGQAAMSMLRREKLSTMGIQILPPMLGLRTAQYIAINDRKKNLVLGMADMGILELSDRDLSFDTFWDPVFMRTKPDWLVVDANWSPGVLARWVTSARKHGARIAFEPVSTAKATRIFTKISTPTETTAVIDFSDSFPNHLIDLAAPNSMELASMHSAARDAGLFDSSGWWHIIDGLGMSNAGSRERLISVTSKSLVDQGVPQQSIQLLPFMPCMLTKLGSQGVLVSQLIQPNDPRLTCPDAAPYILGRAPSQDGLVGGVYLRLFAPDQVLTGEEVVSVNGAGDTLLGVVIAGLARELGKNEECRLENIISVAQKASIKTLKSPDSVNADIKSLAMLFK
jgi:pseudouridylate synthase / pseudouridine kinase